MAASETVESGAFEDHTLLVLLPPVTDILYHSMTEHPSTHLHRLLSLDTALEDRVTVAQEAIHHAGATETISKSLHAVEVATWLQGVLQVQDNLAIHNGGRKGCPPTGLVWCDCQSDAEPPRQPAVARGNGEARRCVVCGDTVSAWPPARVVSLCHH